MIGFIALLPDQSALLGRDRKGKRRVLFLQEHQVIERIAMPTSAQTKLDQGARGMSVPSQVNLHQGHQGHRKQNIARIANHVQYHN